MAVIAGQTLPPDPRTPAATRRVVVKLKPQAAAPPPSPPSDAVDFSARALGDDTWGQLAARYPGIEVKPYFSSAREPQRAGEEAPQSFGIEAADDTGPRYLAIDVPEGVGSMDVASSVRESANVEIAYPEGGPTPPPSAVVNPGDDPRSGNQGHLNAAPEGIDARFAWVSGPTDGSGVTFVDLERGWTLNHEDLADAHITVISGRNTDFSGHGTAVLGEVVAVDNTLGGIGIAPGVTARVVSQWRDGNVYSTADAIMSAASLMRPGDVLLLEAQTTYPTVAGFVPVEVEEIVHDAIVHATSRGIVVIEAGANGGIDLDEFQDLNGRQILNRQSADFRDSGAILVGAASSSVPHQKLDFSNHGSRIDCFAWGENVDTCGDGGIGTGRSVYTPTFGGTSGASPIVAGAAVLLQAWRVGQGLAPFSPETMRRLLSSAANTASAFPGIDRIGVMPDLRAIIEQERLSPSDAALGSVTTVN